MKRIFFMLVMVCLHVLSVIMGCVTSYNVSPYEIPDMESIIIQTTDGTTITLNNPRIEQGKVIGLDSQKKLVKIDVTSIKAVKMNKTSYESIPVFAGTIGAAIVTGMLMRARSTAPDRPPPPPDTVRCCPLVFSWDSAHYILDAEPFGGSICEGLKRTEYCALQFIEDVNDTYLIRVANLLEETQFIDEIKLVIVDHPEGVQIAPDVDGNIHSFTKPIASAQARDRQGKDISSLLFAHDERFWLSTIGSVRPDMQYNLRDTLILEFPKPLESSSVKLLVNVRTTLWGSQMGQTFLELHGDRLSDWYNEVNELGPAFYRIMSWYIREELYLLKIHVETDSGWKVKDLVFSSGPLVADNKVYKLDISDVSGDMLRIMLTPPVNFWALDYIAVDYSQELPFYMSELSSITAITNDRVNVSALLDKEDGDYFIMAEKDQYVDVKFAATSSRPNTERTILLKANGYYQIHLNAKGQPRTEILSRIHDEKDFSIKYALEEYWNSRKFSKR